MIYIRVFYLFLPALILLLAECKPDHESRQSTPVEFSRDAVDKQFVEANQMLVQKESDEMDAYERSHRIRFTRSGSGIRYFVYKASESGDSIRKGMQVYLKYKVYLLDGTLCYSSDEDGIKSFIVEQENIESGIHKGLQYLKRGDKAILLIPSPLAHGLLGDLKKIPPQMPIVYDVEVQ